MSYEQHSAFLNKAAIGSVADVQPTTPAGRFKALREQRNSLARTHYNLVQAKSAANWTDKDQKEADRLAEKIENLEREMDVVQGQMEREADAAHTAPPDVAAKSS